MVDDRAKPTYCKVCAKEAKAPALRKWQQSPQGRYRAQKDAAFARSIPWEFTFQEWLDWWGDDYKYRGNHADELCMARKNDEGSYSPENCYKLTNSENTYEQLSIRWKGHKRTTKVRKKSRPKSLSK